ncbi:cytochrome P450 [Striga asiatica]|uniref:Cytochrome P450 n=1 Tax=Striga asiatica TaxID=4170 RepID=A0A5A7PU98_STRAF|nr:cytochrome P450 [Striga asiatica]
MGGVVLDWGGADVGEYAPFDGLKIGSVDGVVGWGVGVVGGEVERVGEADSGHGTVAGDDLMKKYYLKSNINVKLRTQQRELKRRLIAWLKKPLPGMPLKRDAIGTKDIDITFGYCDTTNSDKNTIIESHPPKTGSMNKVYECRSYSAKAVGSHVGGTSCLTLSDRAICDLSSSTVYRPINQPSKARIFVVDASFFQQPLKSNIALNTPEGTFPDKDKSWLQCSDI